jgi:hypothetical protein
MKKHKIIVTLLIVLFIPCVCSTAALAASAGSDDEFTVVWRYNNAWWPVTINNESVEVWESYSSSQNYVYEHYNTGSVINGVHLPFDVLVFNSTELYTDGKSSGSITNWKPYDIITNPNNLWYPGKAVSPTFLLSKSKDVKAKITYGYIAYDYAAQLGFEDDTYTFTLW